MKICMSSGHGIKIRGAAGPSPWGLDEVNEAIKVMDETAKRLRELGVTVSTYTDSISTSQSENLTRITDWHNAQGSRDYDVSIHFNAYEVTPSKKIGVECLWKTQEDLAAKISAAMATAAQLPNRGAKYRSDLKFLNSTDAKAVLVETLFCDAKMDADSYRQNFPAICLSLAEALAGKKAQPGPTPPQPPTSEPRPPRPTPPESEDYPVLGEGDEGPEVKELQEALGVLEADGDFGPTTETWVKAFQAAAGLSDVDGIVGKQTWAEIDELQERLRDGEPRLPKELAAQIYTMAQTSEIADYSWPDRGVPPQGYVAGMAQCFAYCVSAEGTPAVNVMSQAKGNADKDALAWFDAEFKKLGMSNDAAGVDTLRHLFVLMIGLGPRESSGKYFEGRDLKADNVEPETAEAGLFQTSWNIKGGSSTIEPLLDDFWLSPNGFLDVFKEGLTATKDNLDSYGRDDGARYQFLARFAPLFHVMVTAVGLRTLRQHWGPINRKEVTLKKEADQLLKEVQQLVESVA